MSRPGRERCEHGAIREPCVPCDAWNRADYARLRAIEAENRRRGVSNPYLAERVGYLPRDPEPHLTEQAAPDGHRIADSADIVDADPRTEDQIADDLDAPPSKEHPMTRSDPHEGPTPRDCPECERLHDAADPWDLDPDLPFHPYVACPSGGCHLPANHDNGMAFPVAESMAKNAIRAVREHQNDPTDHVTAVMVSREHPH